ncbi:MAG TPA: HPr-rel-A system PqqD family peptide chaperone [Rubrivivax sp.]|nr:HPr-rel-A system PqqD family peptide chaperone [Rubrivivax sp.]
MCYSPASGQTHLLNDESAAVLELLGLHDGMSPTMICAALAADSGAAASEIEQVMGAAWQLLVDTGLIRQSLPEITPAS